MTEQEESRPYQYSVIEYTHPDPRLRMYGEVDVLDVISGVKIVTGNGVTVRDR